jgi:polysaccharide export outer membrane protein
MSSQINNWSSRFAMLASILVLSVGWQQPSYAQDVTLGPGDIVRVSVYGQKDLDTVAQVSSDGTITFPLLGSVSIGGLTVRTAEQRIATELSSRSLVLEPQVTIFVERSLAAESESVTILGNVSRPGRYPIQTMSAASSENIADVIAMAGGLDVEAADFLLLTRTVGGEQSTLRVDLRQLLEQGDLKQNHVVRNGDIAFVPRMDEFFVYGEVRKPGVYRLRNSMTVIQALSASGGLTERGSEKGITVTRKSDNGSNRSIKVDMNDALQPDDVLIVKEGLF